MNRNCQMPSLAAKTVTEDMKCAFVANTDATNEVTGVGKFTAGEKADVLFKFFGHNIRNKILPTLLLLQTACLLKAYIAKMKCSFHQQKFFSLFVKGVCQIAVVDRLQPPPAHSDYIIFVQYHIHTMTPPAPKCFIRFANVCQVKRSCMTAQYHRKRQKGNSIYKWQRFSQAHV